MTPLTKKLEEKLEYLWANDSQDANLNKVLVKAVEALEEIKSSEAYRCWTCDGGQRFIDQSDEALTSLRNALEGK